MSVSDYLINQNSKEDYLEGFENYVLGYCGDTFKSIDWERSYSVESDWMRVTWQNHYMGAMATLTYTDIESTNIEPESYFSEENIIDFVFADYNNLQKKSSCKDNTGKYILHEYTGEANDLEYLIRFWEVLENDSYLIDFTLVFPPQENELFDIYSKNIFPNLITCSKTDE